jgi:uncharacterized protein (TIGR02300 family)
MHRSTLKGLTIQARIDFLRNPRFLTTTRRGPAVAKPELGTKRVCPETGRKFYDLNKDPIVSPYTGKSYPLSFFEDPGSDPIEEKAEETEAATTEKETEDDAETEGPEVLSLEEADEETAPASEKLPDLDESEDDEVLDEDESDDDTFLPDDDDDDDDDVSGIVDINEDDDD